MYRKSLLLAAAVLIALSMSPCIYAEEHESHASPQHDKSGRAGDPSASPAAKFGPVPGLPGCLTASPKNGDPGKEAFVVLAKANTGCKVPWHWHTGNEQLMIVSGKAKAETKEATSTMSAGDYINLPGKHQHQFTCLASCKFFIESDRAFDIHYVDAEGKEIPQEEALKPAKDTSKHSTRKGMH